MMHQVNIKVTTFEASYCDIIAALSPRVLVVEAQGMHQFVYDGALVVTTRTQSDLLSSSNAANIARAGVAISFCADLDNLDKVSFISATLVESDAGFLVKFPDCFPDLVFLSARKTESSRSKFVWNASSRPKSWTILVNLNFEFWYSMMKIES